VGPLITCRVVGACFALLVLRENFEPFAAQLAGIKGKFLLSLNDTPGAREVFGAFAMGPVDTRYTVANGAASKAGELPISNFARPC
jgi:DNA adenine methylase